MTTTRLVLLLACGWTLGACSSGAQTSPDGGPATDPDDDAGAPVRADAGKVPPANDAGVDARPAADATAPPGPPEWTIVPGLVDDVVSIWAAGPNDVWYATDGSGSVALRHFDGKTWTGFSGPTMNTVWGLAPDNVWAAGANAFYHWDGASWAPVTPKVTTGTINAIGGSASDLWVVGEFIGDANLRHSDGVSWDFGGAHDPPAPYDKVALHALSGDWAFGSGGAILHWNGASWDAPAVRDGKGWFGAWSPDASRVFTVGTSNTVAMATSVTNVSYLSDRIIGDFPLSDSLLETLFGVWGSSSTDIWVVGTGGHIVHRVGSSWSLGPALTTATLRCITGTGASDIWVGGDGVLLHYAPPPR